MRIAPLLLLLVAWSAWSQGEVNFSNTSTTRLTTNDLQGNTGFTTGLNAYRIGFYMAPAGTADPAAFNLFPPVTVNSYDPLNPNRDGRFSGSGNSGSVLLLPEELIGVTIAFQVRAWSYFAGLTYEEALLYPGAERVYVGSSTIGAVAPGGGFSAPVANLFGVQPGQVGGFELTPRIIPEPATWALVVVGAGVFWCATRRWRKA